MRAVIYSKDPCMYCVLAKNLLEAKNVEYEEIDGPTHIEQLMSAVREAGSHPPRTFPQIFLEGRHIGGYNELARLFRVNT